MEMGLCQKHPPRELVAISFLKIRIFSIFFSLFDAKDSQNDDFFRKIMLIFQIFSIELRIENNQNNQHFSDINWKNSILRADIDRDRICKNNEKFC